MTSVGRRSELQALVFDPQYIQLKPKGAGVTLYFTPEFMLKNQRPNQVNDPWYIPAVPTGKPEFHGLTPPSLWFSFLRNRGVCPGGPTQTSNR